MFQARDLAFVRNFSASLDAVICAPLYRIRGTKPVSCPVFAEAMSGEVPSRKPLDPNELTRRLDDVLGDDSLTCIWVNGIRVHRFKVDDGVIDLRKLFNKLPERTR